MYALAAKGDMEGAKKVVIAEHNRCQKNILKFSESMANAAVEAEQEFFNEGKFENIDVVHNTYDHTKTVNYHLKEVQNKTLKEEKYFNIYAKENNNTKNVLKDTIYQYLFDTFQQNPECKFEFAYEVASILLNSSPQTSIYRDIKFFY